MHRRIDASDRVASSWGLNLTTESASFASVPGSRHFVGRTAGTRDCPPTLSLPPLLQISFFRCFECRLPSSSSPEVDAVGSCWHYHPNYFRDKHLIDGNQFDTTRPLTTFVRASVSVAGNLGGQHGQPRTISAFFIPFPLCPGHRTGLLTTRELRSNDELVIDTLANLLRQGQG